MRAAEGEDSRPLHAEADRRVPAEGRPRGRRQPAVARLRDQHRASGGPQLLARPQGLHDRLREHAGRREHPRRGLPPLGLEQARAPPPPLAPRPRRERGHLLAHGADGPRGRGGARLSELDTAMARIGAMAEIGTMRVKSGLAEMLKGGVIMDVTTAEQARIAEEAGACAVMALERVPADIRREGGVARMADPDKIREIQEAVTIPVMAKARIGHFVEAQILEALEVDYIDESEVLTPADEEHHIDKWRFTVPFVCGARNLGEALRRLSEGAAMIRTKGEAGTGNVVEAVTHMRTIQSEMRRLVNLPKDELPSAA